MRDMRARMCVCACVMCVRGRKCASVGCKCLSECKGSSAYSHLRLCAIAGWLNSETPMGEATGATLNPFQAKFEE